MAFSLFCLFEACILLFNTLAILNPRYFLKKYKLDSLEGIDGYSNPMKKQLAFLLYAARTYGRIPLIFANSSIILLELLLG
ncbi:hypothetical protein SteCoe_32112 [Stentor coeruleus]|uniref:Immediate early response 3-interacting protein 1 n=1 Tax=Stentor coeruleus TaxID=5963 RepID=A0A1R2AZQ5_9CILI|nr:hypothetical protein SteCoe_32112 [Stentor coeruleus]